MFYAALNGIMNAGGLKDAYNFRRITPPVDPNLDEILNIEEVKKAFKFNANITYS